MDEEYHRWFDSVKDDASVFDGAGNLRKILTFCGVFSSLFSGKKGQKYESLCNAVGENL